MTVKQSVTVMWFALGYEQNQVRIHTGSNYRCSKSSDTRGNLRTDKLANRAS